MIIPCRPSASHRWTECLRSARFALELPEQEPNDPAREGTCAAWVAEMVLTGQAEKTDDLIDASHENGWLVDVQMVHDVQKYIDHLRAHGGSIEAERKVYLNPMIEGTPDAYAVVNNTTLIADDLKYGYKIVEPYRNTQVAIYAAALLKMLNHHGVIIDKIIIGIYQPRASHPEGIYRTWELTPNALMEFVAWIEGRAHAAQDVSCKATPGVHCMHCQAAHKCDALDRTNYRNYDVISGDSMVDMPPEMIAHKLDFYKKAKAMMDAAASALETEAKSRMKRSEHIPGYGFEDQYGRKVFTASADVIKALTGVDPYASPKLATPAEIVRRSKNKKQAEKFIARHTSRPRIPPKLVKRAPDYYTKLFKKGQT